MDVGTSPSRRGESVRIDRRTALRAGLVAAGGLLFAPARRAIATPSTRRLDLYAVHTGERLRADYAIAGHYQRETLREVDRLLRDHRSGDVHPIDPALLDLLYALTMRLDVRGPVQVICGYRSPETNARKLAAGERVAVHSFHLTGRAIDLAVPGRSTARVRRAALALRRGGVGYYPRDGFVHIDTGPIRAW